MSRGWRAVGKKGLAEGQMELVQRRGCVARKIAYDAKNLGALVQEVMKPLA